MLGKLIKYEWKACARACLPLYGAVILVAIINRLLAVVRIDDFMGTLPTVIAGFLYFGVMVAVFVVTTVILVQRFYKSLLGDEGYLMFTLPVTAGQHIWSKTIVAFIMSTLSTIAATISAMILVLGSDFLFEFNRFMNDLFRAIGEEPRVLLYCVELFILFILMSMAFVLFIYLCIAIGHLAKRHRVAGSVVAFFGLFTLLEIIIGIVFSAADRFNLFGFIYRLPDDIESQVIMLIVFLITGVLTAAFFLGTRHILTKKLNLE